MSYLVLARKYRPRTFEEVAGQDVSTRVLAGAIAEQRIGHAYLFSGPRGTGKTTTARIFAKALNCEQGPTATPCGTCERCVAADAGNDVDIVEIDAASNTGVDSVRDLRDQAAYMPLKSRFKVYIIDEVHMLSKQAFNALLKTLEEPPPHVKFLFATTEPHKVLDTILSRCQVLKLAPIPERVINARLQEVFAAEGVEAEEGVTAELARLARGGMRDALSLADQLLALVGSRPALEDVVRMRGDGSSRGVEALVERILAGDPKDVLESLPATEGGEEELIDALLAHLRNVLLAGFCREDSPMLEGVRTAGLAKLANRLGASTELWLEELLAARERMRRVPSQARLVLELCLLDLCRGDVTVPLEELVLRLEALERGAPAPAPARGETPASPTAGPAASQAASPEPQARAASPQSSEPRPRRVDSMAARSAGHSAADAWRAFLDRMQDKAPSLAKVLDARGKLIEFTGARAVVQLSNLRDPERVLLEDKRNRTQCARVFAAVVGRDIELELQDTSAAKSGNQDPFTRQVADLFGGRIEDES